MRDYCTCTVFVSQSDKSVSVFAGAGWMLIFLFSFFGFQENDECHKHIGHWSWLQLFLTRMRHMHKGHY